MSQTASQPSTDPTADGVPPHRYTPALAQQIELAWQDRWETEGTFHVEVLDTLCNDDWATVLCTTTATRKGRTVTIDDVDVLRLRNGQVVEFWNATTDPQATIEAWAD